MRVATFQSEGGERVGVVEGDEIVDVSDVAPSMLALVQGGSAALEAARRAAGQGRRLRLDQVRLLAPFPRPTKNIFCLGLNYKEHVAEGARSRSMDLKLPEYPVWFTKAVTSICGPYDDVPVDSAVSTQYDWEVELAVIVGPAGRRIAKERVFDHVWGYCVFNDFSVRDIQRRHGGQWFKGKSLDRASPMGPWLVTADEVPHPDHLQVMCRVNGELKQNANTEDMLFDIPTMLADISEVLTLEPGDIIATGTPSGVGFARTPPEFLKPGDVMETEIESLGLLRNRIVADS
jgi:2-keto-4-pentenoate hydratase/2-oxohepta-3-ene-1,7-dioic acid hydratase in catechol pathway